MSKNIKWLWLAGVFGLLVYPSFVLAVIPYQDDDRPPARVIGDFEYADTTQGPLENGWLIKSGTGTAACSTLAPAAGDIKASRFASGIIQPNSN